MVTQSPPRQATATTEIPYDRIYALLKKPRAIKSGKGGDTGSCPAHHDANNSLMIWEDENDHHVGVMCFAGCTRKAVCEAWGITESDLYIQDDNRKPKQPKLPSLSLFDMAADKQIHPNDLYLLDSGIVDRYEYKGRRAVYIPYRNEDGSEYTRSRIRTHVKAKDGSKWNTDNKDPLIPYGLQWLSEARKEKYLVIVEGETDVWTLKLHKFHALGIPGARSTSSLQIEHLRGIDKVYIIREPDDAGGSFAADLKKRLSSIGYTGKAYVLDFKTLTGAKDPNELHQQDVRAFKDTFKGALASVGPKKPTIMRLCDLQKEEIPSMKWAIEPILPEGVTILGGKPKLGKSWLALALLDAVSRGGVALGRYPVDRGEVLYIDLEDNKRRLQSRSNTYLRDQSASEDFHCCVEWSRINEGGYEQLEEHLQEHPRTRIICIDTWARFKPRSTGSHKLLYDEDYDALSPLQGLASKYGVSILIVDHMRKMDSEDPLDMVSGSTGKTGAVDGFLLLFRKRGEANARLFVTGKDIEEEQELLLTFNQDCASWVVNGDADDTTIATTPQQQEILWELDKHKQGLSVKELAKRLDKNVNTTRNLLVKLRNEGKVSLQNNIYCVVTHSKDSKDSKRSNHSNLPGNEAENGNGGYYATTPLTMPLTTGVVTRSNPLNGHGKLTQPTSLPQLTTVTTLTMDPIEKPETEVEKAALLQVRSLYVGTRCQCGCRLKWFIHSKETCANCEPGAMWPYKGIELIKMACEL